MTSCPFCQSNLEEKTTACSSCNAKKGYLKIDNLIFGKNLLIFLGLIIPFMITLYGFSAQNLFGVYVSIFMTLPILFTTWHLVLGVRWIK
jgi:hypothetical protein